MDISIEIDENPRDLNALGNVMRGIEDQIEQNDNMIDGIINNKAEETVSEKEERTSVVKKLKELSARKDDRQSQIIKSEELE